jgi:hypothetical protein
VGLKAVKGSRLEEKGGANGLLETGQLVSNIGPDWSEVHFMQ